MKAPRSFYRVNISSAVTTFTVKKKKEFTSVLRCTENTSVRLPKGFVQWNMFLFPRNSHANNFSSFLFAHQTHAARLLFSLSTPQYFMPLRVHLFSAFPRAPPPTDCQNIIFYHSTPLHLLNPLSAFKVEAIMCIRLTVVLLNELFYSPSEPHLGSVNPKTSKHRLTWHVCCLASSEPALLAQGSRGWKLCNLIS